VLRSSPSIAPNPPSGADSHVPDPRSGSGTLTTRLWQCSAGRQPTWYAVCSRCLTRRHDSYHLRLYDHISDALATLHWLRVPERAQYKIAVLTFRVLHDSAPWYLGPLVLWPARSASSAVSKYQPPSRAAYQAVYCWQPCLSGCRSSSLERSVRGRRLIVIIADFPPSIKNSSFSTFIPSRDFWPFHWHRYSSPCSNVRYLGHYKNLCLLTYLYWSQ